MESREKVSGPTAKPINKIYQWYFEYMTNFISKLGMDMSLRKWQKDRAQPRRVIDSHWWRRHHNDPRAEDPYSVSEILGIAKKAGLDPTKYGIDRTVGLRRGNRE